MKITKKQLSLEDGLQNEWVVSNGIGGYASTTVIGANTRRILMFVKIIFQMVINH